MFTALTRCGLGRITILPTFQAFRANSTLTQLSEAIRTSGKDAKVTSNKSVADDLDHLLLSESRTKWQQNEVTFGLLSGTDYLLQQNIRHPRDVAKSIREYGPMAGRAVDVRAGNVSGAVGGVKRLINNNRIRPFQKVQSRHIRMAKLHKMKRSRWWRSTFSEGFKKLMGQVRDATRRGY